MGRRPNPASGAGQRIKRSLVACLGAVALLGAAFSAVGSAPAAAQTITDMLQGRSGANPGGQKDKMLVEAKEMIYNRDDDTIAASGDVQIYYQGKVLQADKVIYNRKTKRLYAEGNAKLTEPDGTVTYGSRFDLSDDFRDGFVDSLTAKTKDNTRLTSPRAERTEGDTMVLEDATYTACAPCADNPARPPLWQIKAKRIIHKNQEQMIYYEDATLELLGIPFAWVPFMSSPDPSVTRKSGILAPHFVYNTFLGAGVGIPIYWAMAPSYDLTVTPTILSRQGFFGRAEWRQRLLHGSYTIRATGIFEEDPKAFALPPYGAGDHNFRGSLETQGKFLLSDKWSVGWNAALWSDKFYLNDYKLSSNTVLTDYFRESVSTAYLTGKGDRGYFDLRGYYIEGLDVHDIQRQQPVVAPIIDYNKAFTLPQDTTWVGGELTLDFNYTHLSRQLADYQSVGVRQLDPVYGLFNVCDNTAVTPGAAYQPGKCFVRGIAGDYDRATGQASWRRNITDPFGGLWQPFAFARVSGDWASLNLTGGDTFGPASILNASQSNFFGSSSQSQVSVMPGAGVEYRFPLVASTSWATHVFEPIAQLVVRPNESATSSTINEDAQSLVFDDTTLFEWNKFSGYDRVEGGTRLNAGAQYTMTFNSGAYANALVGQSFQLAGRNSYAIGDDANTGLDTGLQNSRSYYITRLSFVPSSSYSFTTKANFDPDTFALKRLDFAANVNFGHLNFNVLYARYAAEPDIGFNFRREGLGLGSKYNLTSNYYISGNITFDMSRYLYDPLFQQHNNHFSPASYGLGFGYNDDCTTIGVNYSSGYTYTNGAFSRSQTVLLNVTLRTLGEIKANQTIGADTVADGIGRAAGSD